ncbi:glycosyltransferase family 8 protein, partial [Helicobacter salomonis]|uniref:glycosyltransferase family 8 protein n=2 Tax=Helicobacter salomonis TaxID=56878 RepID=UPI001B3297B4
NNRTTEQQNNRTTEQQNNRTLSEKFDLILRSVDPIALERFSPFVLARFILPSLFPQYDKLITCDVDVVFVKDMSESYFALNTDDPYYLAVAKEFRGDASVAEAIRTRLIVASSKKITIDRHFLSPEQWQILYENPFNMGFAVFNLKAWRKSNLEEQCIEFFAHKGHGLCYPEQDALTLLCHGYMLELPHTYNTNPFHFNIPNHPIHQAVQNTNEVIMWHFCGEIKPWEPQNFHAAPLWIRALVRTPFTTTYFERYDRWIADKDSKAYLSCLEPLLTKKVLRDYIFYKIQKTFKRWYTDLCFWWKLKKI